MKNLLVPAALAATLAFASGSFAGGLLPSYESGTIVAIDLSARTVTMDHGAVFYFPATVDLSAFKVGEAARIAFTMEGAKHDALFIKAN